MKKINDCSDFPGVNNSRSISTRACACYNQGICDPYTSSCICPSGYHGYQCEQLQCRIKISDDNVFCTFQPPLYAIILLVEMEEYAT